MKVGIYESDIWAVPKYNKVYKEILELNNIPWEGVSLDTPDFWKKISKMDYFIFRYVHVDEQIQIANTILPIIETKLNKNVFPDQKTCWHFDDKIKQYYLSKINQIPFTDSYIFWDKKAAKAWAEKTEYPIIFKLKGGAGSQNVLLVKKKSHAIKIINKLFRSGIKNNSIPSFSATKFLSINTFLKSIFYPLYSRLKGRESNLFWNKHKNYALFQKYLPNNEYDTRITVIGKYAYGFRRFNRKKDFRASGSGIIDYNTSQIDKRCLKIAFETSKKMGFQSMAYDFLYNEKNEPEICEMSYTYQDKALFDCSGIWDENLNWKDGHFWPGYLHLKDLLKRSNLIQPDKIIF